MLDVPLMLIGPFMGHVSFKLWFYGKGVWGLVPTYFFSSDRRPAFFCWPAREGILGVIFFLAAGACALHSQALNHPERREG